MNADPDPQPCSKLYSKTFFSVQTDIGTGTRTSIHIRIGIPIRQDSKQFYSGKKPYRYGLDAPKNDFAGEISISVILLPH